MAEPGKEHGSFWVVSGPRTMLPEPAPLCMLRT